MEMTRKSFLALYNQLYIVPFIAEYHFTSSVLIFYWKMELQLFRIQGIRFDPLPESLYSCYLFKLTRPSMYDLASIPIPSASLPGPHPLDAPAFLPQLPPDDIAAGAT